MANKVVERNSRIVENTVNRNQNIAENVVNRNNKIGQKVINSMPLNYKKVFSKNKKGGKSSDRLNSNKNSYNWTKYDISGLNDPGVLTLPFMKYVPGYLPLDLLIKN